ncbi:MAG: iron-containing alcohol dehydrogenase [Pseudomonadota bacterium]|nr:iron-containing alcohol dehydrogenase [Pseudomonadota bacterium]MEE2859679.1 iron-containing alcohol dehydrogenase [Pseudomonadota bacterium]
MRSYYPTELIFAVGAAEQLQTQLDQRGVRRPLFVSDEGVAAAGLVDKVRGALADPAASAVFAETCENPLVSDVEKALAIYREAGCDGIVALGGGSSIDCAKSVALTSTHEGALRDYAATRPQPLPIGPDVAPLIAIPTTAGTGSEVGRGIGLSEHEGAPKMVIYGEALIPKVTICDPLLTVTMPAAVTAASGVDALSHCIEGYLSTTDHPVADALALSAIERIVVALPKAVANGSDLEARGQMLLSAAMGGMAMHKGLGPAHAAGVPLDLLGIRHGVLVGILLPHALRFLEPAVGARLDRIAQAMGLDDGSQVAGAVTRLNDTVGLPARLMEVGVERHHIPPAAAEAEGSFFNKLSARQGTAQDYEAILEAAL